MLNRDRPQVARSLHAGVTHVVVHPEDTTRIGDIKDRMRCDWNHYYEMHCPGRVTRNLAGYDYICRRWW